MDLIVSSEGFLHCNDMKLQCAYGKAGFIAEQDKREGDNKTPCGTYNIWPGYYRADRLSVKHSMLKPLDEHQGWCDAPSDAQYNQPVTLPYRASCETMFRDDHVYNIVFPTSHNQSPTKPGAGSAIFLHLAHDHYRGTEGCIAVSLQDMLRLLPHIDSESRLIIQN